MRNLRPWFAAAILGSMLVAGAAIAADTVIIEGKITDDYHLITDDGKTYELAADDEHWELLYKLTEEIGRRARVRGEVETDEYNVKTINILSYELVSAKGTEKQGARSRLQHMDCLSA